MGRAPRSGGPSSPPRRRPHVDRPYAFDLASSSAAPKRLASGASLARKVEDLGYSTLLVADHFGRQLAPLPALVAAASATTSPAAWARSCSTTTFGIRRPLAKEAATVDVLTDGRLELGIGAGWNPSDYTKTGLTFEARRERASASSRRRCRS